MSVSRTQIEVEFHAAERALEAARERREAAERELWRVVSRSGGGSNGDEVDAARSEVTEADRELVEVERMVADLRSQLEVAQHREERLLAVTDMLIARDEARRTDALHVMEAESPKRRKSILGRLFGH